MFPQNVSIIPGWSASRIASGFDGGNSSISLQTSFKTCLALPYHRREIYLTGTWRVWFGTWVTWVNSSHLNISRMPHRSHSLTSCALLILKVRRCCTTAVPVDPLGMWCILEFGHVASSQIAHDATILLAFYPGKKKVRPSTRAPECLRTEANVTSSSPWVEFVTEEAICTFCASSSTEEVEDTLLAHSVIETYHSPVQFSRNIKVRVVPQKLML